MQEEPQLDEIYRLTRENNRMLHAMRRNALLGGIIKFALYAALILGPLWLIQPYLSSLIATMNQLQGALEQVHGAGMQSQTQLQGLEEALKKVQSYIPSLPKTQ